eukprot:5972963-Ditylum_brightwellii.AAC.1
MEAIKLQYEEAWNLYPIEWVLMHQTGTGPMSLLFGGRCKLTTSKMAWTILYGIGHIPRVIRLLELHLRGPIRIEEEMDDV